MDTTSGQVSMALDITRTQLSRARSPIAEIHERNRGGFDLREFALCTYQYLRHYCVPYRLEKIVSLFILSRINSVYPSSYTRRI